MKRNLFSLLLLASFTSFSQRKRIIEQRAFEGTIEKYKITFGIAYSSFLTQHRIGNGALDL